MIDSSTSTVKSIKKSTVVTYDGSIHPRANCRRIKDMYYLIGNINIKNSGHCYLIDETYYIDSGENSKIQWDYTNKKYTINLAALSKGIVDKKGTIGYFSPDISSRLLASYNGREMYIMDESCIPSFMYYDYSDGYYKAAEKVANNKPFVSERNKPCYQLLKTDMYGFGEDPMTGNVEKIFNENLKNVEKHVFDKYFGKYTHGLEIETDGGWLPECYYFKHGALPLKDGSIYGTEITTFPYTGERMFNNLHKLTQACSKYTISSYNTSVHNNIGNVPNNPYFRTAVWILYCRLQSEIETFIPPYKRDQRFFMEKRGRGKDHCRIQESLGLLRRYINWKAEIPLADSQIKQFLNEGNPGKLFVKREHQKWDQRTRYYALNLLPMYFPKDDKSTRVEFRVHSGTVNPTKILCWTFICTAIVKYAEEQQEKIFVGKEKITLEDVIDYSFNDGTPEGEFLGEYLKAYIAHRSKEHIDNIASDNVYGTEFTRDNVFEFVYKKNTLFSYEPSKRSQFREENSKRVPGDRF